MIMACGIRTERGVNMYRFSDTYTIEEMDNLLFNMLEIVTDLFDADYNDGIIKSKEELIQKYINIGMHKDEVLDMCDWLEEN